MKTKPSAIKSLLAAALAASCLASYAAAPQKREMKFEKLRKEFADPPRAFRPAPLWVWNTQVTRADIDRMLGDFKAQGFGGAFVHPRPGLVTEYLSDEWFDLYKYSVEKGKELGLDIWIYDENSYPSGFAGGHVPAQMPESYDQGQGLALTKAALPPADAGKYFLCLKKEGGTFRDITADTGRYKDVPGEYYLYEKTYYGRSGWHGGYSYVDLLVEGVTEKFLGITMEGYEKTFGKELGPVIKGLFSDEPCIPSSGGVRWTPDLFEVFRKQWGYDLVTSLPLLSEQTGDWKRVRHNYLETLTQMFVDRWAKPMSAYCDRKGMLWTGHYWEHDWPSMYQGGDNMAMYAWHQMPAIDMLFNQYNDDSPQAQFGNVRAVKELRSAANQTGSVRTLSETYGGGGWDETFRDFKRLGDWEYGAGREFHEPAPLAHDHRRRPQIRLSAGLHPPLAVVGGLQGAERLLRTPVTRAQPGRTDERHPRPGTDHDDLALLLLCHERPPLHGDRQRIPAFRHHARKGAGGIRPGLGEHHQGSRLGQGR